MSGIESHVKPKPEFFEMTIRAREAAKKKAARSIHKDNSDEDSDDETSKGLGACAELPTGIPMWLPTVFLAQDKTYSMPWQKRYLVRDAPRSRKVIREC